MARYNYKGLFEKLLVSFSQEDDPIQSMLKWMTEQLMETEVTSLKTKVEKGKHSEERESYRNGYRVRRWDTRVGSIYLLVPKVREGGYQPFFLVNKQRSETALLSVIHEAYINGVSTRKMNRLARELGVDHVSAGQVSLITKDLNQSVTQLKERSLQEYYPIVWVDALYEKVRSQGKVKKMAVMTAMGITADGKKELLDVELMENESTQTWTVFFDRLKKRGLKNICLLVADAHEGIRAGLGNVYPKSEWQRCKVHFMRNIMARVPHKMKKSFVSLLDLIWKQPTREDAKKIAKQLTDRFGLLCPEAIDILEEGLEDSLKYYDYPKIPPSRISSTNQLERLNREIRRRSRVVTVFPNKDSYLRLVVAYLLEYEEESFSDRSYIAPERIEETFLQEVQLEVA